MTSQYEPIESFEEPELSPDHVNERVEDWLQRLNDLFEQIKSWTAANGWTVKDGAPILMHEEMMVRVGLPARDQPSLSVRSPAGTEIWIKPKGLWVIGANGRVDFFSPKGAFTLVDTSEAFEKPSWILHRVGDGKKGKPFAPDLLSQMV